MHLKKLLLGIELTTKFTEAGAEKENLHITDAN